MDNPEKLATLRGNQEWTIQRNWQHWVHKPQDEINVRENRRGNQEWTIQRNWQHWVHKPQNKDKQIQETIVVNITQCQYVFLFFFGRLFFRPGRCCHLSTVLTENVSLINASLPVMLFIIIPTSSLSNRDLHIIEILVLN